MFVWWAVFFFAGVIFPASVSGAVAALVASAILTFLYGSSGPQLRARFFLTCASGIFVLVTSSLSPIDIDILSGCSRPAVSRRPNYPVPARAVREGIIRLTDDSRLSAETGSLLRALLVADRRSLPYYIRRDFQRTGTAHYLALSGLHLGLIALPLFGILTLSGTRGVLRDAIALFALSFYATVAGRPGSLLRALSMLTFLRSTRIAGIRTGPGRCVIAGAFLVCILDPASLNDTGFLLSFNAAAGVAMLGVPVCASIQRYISGKRMGRSVLPPLLALSMSLCVQLSMLPLLVRLFGFAPLSGPFMSVILSLPVTFLLYSGFLYVIVGHLFASLAARPLNLLSALITGTVSRGAAISRIGLIITDRDIRLYVPGLLVAAFALKTEKYRKAVLTAGMLLVASSFWPLLAGGGEAEEGTVRFLFRGAILSGGNRGILVLDEPPSPWFAQDLSREVRRCGVRGIGVLVILGTGKYDCEGLSSLVGELGPERVFLSPWLAGECADDAGNDFVRVNTPVESGGVHLLVRPPRILPGRGATAHGKDAALSISPLD